MQRRLLVRLGVSALAASLSCVFACVSDSPAVIEVTGDDASSGSDGTSSGGDDATGSGDVALGDTASGDDVATGGDTATVDATDGNPADVAPDTGPTYPSITCSAEPIGTAAYYNCRASAASGTPGGMIAPGTYHLTGVHDATACTADPLMQGNATIFTDASTNLFMRFLVDAAAQDAAPVVTKLGTLWLQPDAAGNVTRTELCDATTLHQVTQLQFSVNGVGTGATLTFFYPSGRTEIWTLQ